MFSQIDTTRKKVEKYPYDRREEILWNAKRYRKYNNYLTLGAGFLRSSIRNDISKLISVDYHFHIKREYFQLGVVMSGDQFTQNDNIQLHAGYGLRKEKNTSNLAFYGGLTYYTGVIAISDTANGTETIPRYYQGLGIYACGQIVTKLSYDIGLGLEGFAEYNREQALGGLKVILFFSGAYRGPKKNYNPHVRSENKK